jgi:hypothetical protein
MSDATPAHEFLCEVADLAGFIDDVLAMPRGSCWHWPSYYLFYVEVDRLGGLLTRIRWQFESPCSGLAEPSSAQEDADSANALFALLDKSQRAVVDGLSQLWRNTRSATGNTPAYQRLEAHVHLKSGWYQLFRRGHCTGRMSADGASLRRAVLGVDTGSSPHHISYPTAECMLRHQSFDLRPPASKAALAKATAQAETRLGTTLAAMGTLLVEYCTIKDLVHPSSR